MRLELILPPQLLPAGGIPEAVAYHDVSHVLAGHDTSPSGEIQQGSFQGGNRREDGFFFIQFAILQFHHGVKITPATFPTTDLFDPEKVLWAIHRGAQCNVDMTHQWNFWPLMELPLDEARARCMLLPKLAERVPDGCPRGGHAVVRLLGPKVPPSAGFEGLLDLEQLEVGEVHLLRFLPAGAADVNGGGGGLSGT